MHHPCTFIIFHNRFWCGLPTGIHIFSFVRYELDGEDAEVLPGVEEDFSKILLH
jgi:hypothetical protein